MKETFVKISTRSKILSSRLYVSGVALKGHGIFNSNQIYLVLITLSIQKRVSKNNSKKLKKTRQLAKTDISDFKLECAKMFLMNFQAKIPSGTGLSAQEE